MLNLPDIEYGTSSPSAMMVSGITDAEAILCLVCMQNFATEVLRYLARNGSSIKIFGAHPPMRCDQRPSVHPKSSHGTGDQRLRIREHHVILLSRVLADAPIPKIRLKADQRNVVLVSRAWRNIMYPLMWERFETDMRLTSG